MRHRRLESPAISRSPRSYLLLGLTIALFWAGSLPARAQSEPDPHAPHHPAAPSSGNPPTQPSAGPQPSTPAPSPPSGGMMGMMGEMMERPSRQLFPELMNVPTLTPEEHRRVEALARARIDAGNEILSKAQVDFQRAMLEDDAAAMSRAAVRQRAGLALIDSGAAVLRALADGKPPQQIALAWFRNQLSLTPAAPTSTDRGVSIGSFQVSWFHFITMIALVLFAVAMAVLGLAQRRRAAALINRLTSSAPVAFAGHPVVPGAPGSPGSPPRQPPAQAAPAPRTDRNATAPESDALPARVAVKKSWSGQLRVSAIYRETPHVKTFRLVDPSGGPIPFTYSPGQFLTFSADIDGKKVRRSYSIASPPTRVAYAEITVKREENGTFSDYLHDRLVVGDLLEASGPAGIFTFDGGGAESVVLIAGGVGITPLMCVVRYLTDLTWPGDIYLLFAGRSTEDFIFQEEIEYLQRRCPNLHVAATMMNRAEGTAWLGFEGQLTKQIIAQAVPEITRRQIHLCGPPAMMDAVRTMLSDLGVPQSRIKTEAFGPAIGALPPPAPQTPQPPPGHVAAVLRELEAVAPGLASTTSTSMGPATALVRFARSDRTAPLPPDRTVLEVAESVGVPIDYSCRVGTCGICKVRLLEGKVGMEVEDALTAEDKAAGIILACQARSVGNLTIDA
ncbi:MAG: 2Fe-2S iron-sulfur cluster binding domain-containing protein [Nitrospirae bacterium]|nr:MAG: 2Fe-2S iron-sulfur cluster binding domain-containing protein [Nitrospirota bacterium]